MDWVITNPQVAGLNQDFDLNLTPSKKTRERDWDNQENVL